MLRYTYHAREDDREYIDRGLDALGNENARRVAMTIAERIKQEGRTDYCIEDGDIRTLKWCSKTCADPYQLL